MKNALISLKDYRLDNLSFGELIKRLNEDFGKLPENTLTDVPAKNYLAGLATRSAVFDKALIKITFNEESKKIADSDQVRDLSVFSLWKAVKVFKTSDVVSEKEAARVILSVLNNYKGLANFDYEKESNGIDNLINDLESTTYNNHVTTLNLGRYITRLKTDNAAFRALFAGRVSIIAGKEVLDCKALRKDLQEYYNEFCLYIQAMANASATPAQFITALTLINTVRKYYADKLAHHLGVIDSQKKANTTPVK
jgi:hypothetical protein